MLVSAWPGCASRATRPGGCFRRSFVRAVLEAAPDVLVCIDEAYYEISGVTLADLVLQYPNAVLVRTFSKGYGLAGARVGYLVGQRDVTQTIESVRLPQNMTAFGLAAASRALADQAGLHRRVQAIVAERERLGASLRHAAGRRCRRAATSSWPVRPLATPRSAWLQGGGLIVRTYAGHPRLNKWLRISVRSPEEDDRLLRRLDARSG